MNKPSYGRRIIDERRGFRRWIDPRVWSLPVADVIVYLHDRDWKERESDRPHFRVFEEPTASVDGKPYYQFVPTFEGEPGYGQQMYDLLTGLAEFEDRQASAIIDDILDLADRRRHNGAAAKQPAKIDAGC
jgi:hypothetical protein